MPLSDRCVCAEIQGPLIFGKSPRCPSKRYSHNKRVAVTSGIGGGLVGNVAIDGCVGSGAVSGSCPTGALGAVAPDCAQGRVSVDIVIQQMGAGGHGSLADGARAR